jgi:hypothetical protein
LTQYPELAKELEEEIKKMEEENAAKQAELEEMQNQLSSNPPPQGVNADDDDADSPEQLGVAFVSKTNTSVDGEDSSIYHGTLDNSQEDSNDFTITEEDVEDDEQETEGEFWDEGVQREKDDQVSHASTSATKNDDVASPVGAPSSSKEDFTLSYLAIESLRAFVKNAKDDLKRIIELVVPVMRPLLTAGDVAWRQIKALFLMVRDAYNESSSSQSSSDESTTSSEEQQVGEAATKTEECENVVS